MPLIKWKPFFEPFEDMAKYFEEEFPLLKGEHKGFIPTVDVYEEGKNIIVEIPLAGVDPEDVDVFIENDVLTIQGESKHKTEVDEENYYHKEMRYGNFYRTVSLPTHVKGDKAKAEFENGLLKVVVPKDEAKKTKSIKVTKKSTAKKSKKFTKSAKKKSK